MKIFFAVFIMLATLYGLIALFWPEEVEEEVWLHPEHAKFYDTLERLRKTLEEKEKGG